MSRSALAAFVAFVLFAGPSSAQQSIAAAQPVAAPAMAYAETTPAYRFFPGDEVEVTVFSAPELSRTVTVGPDGRITLPMIAPVARR